MRPIVQPAAVAMALFISLCLEAAAQTPPGRTPTPAPGNGQEARDLLYQEAGALVDRNVYLADGELLGEVERIAIDKKSAEPAAIVGMGGFLGLFEERAAIPLRQLVPVGRTLMLTQPLNTEAVQAEFPYLPERLVTIPEDAVIANILEPANGRIGVDFSTVDADGDGYITPEEAQGHERVSFNWQQLDANKDGVVSEAEFAVFQRIEDPEPPIDGGVQPEPGIGRGGGVFN